MIEETILQFVRGDIDFGAFFEEYRKNKKIIQCLENMVACLGDKGVFVTYDAVFRANFPAEKAEYYIQRNGNDHTDVVVPNKNFPTVKSLMDHFINSNCSSFMKRSEIYNLIFSIVVAAKPDTGYYHKYSDDFEFFIRAVPDYVAGGEEACNYIEKEVVPNIPSDISEAQRIRLCREMVKQSFHVAGSKYPRWAQSAEWPIVNGKPARYLGYKRKGDLAECMFEDTITGEPITVKQYY